jgi:hypothetical protein
MTFLILKEKVTMYHSQLTYVDIKKIIDSWVTEDKPVLKRANSSQSHIRSSRKSMAVPVSDTFSTATRTETAGETSKRTLFYC